MTTGQPEARRALRRQLQALGVGGGDLLMVHCSMRRVGGRAEDLLQALIESISPDGTLVMVLGADTDEPFDHRSTPVDVEDMGVLAELFRTWPGVRVTDHAACRWGARGPRADDLLDGTPLHDYHGPDGTLARLTGAGARVLRLGADPDTVTVTHLAEYLADVPGKRRVQLRYVRADSGEQWIASLDDTVSFVEADPEGTYFPQVYSAFSSTPAVARGPVGGCEAEIFDAATFVSFAVAWLEARFGPKS